MIEFKFTFMLHISNKFLEKLGYIIAIDWLIASVCKFVAVNQQTTNFGEWGESFLAFRHPLSISFLLMTP